MSDVPEKIRSARERLQLTQQQLADRVGISQTTIDKIERGLTKNSRHLLSISRMLQIPISEIDSRDVSAEIDPSDSSIFKVKGRIPVYKPLASYIVDLADKSLQEGVFIQDNAPFDFVENKLFSDEWMGGGYAIYIGNSSLSPELEIGDIVFVDERRPVFSGATCVLGGRIRGSGPPSANKLYEIRIIGRLQGSDQNYWSLAIHNPKSVVKLQKKDWPIVQRVVAKHYRG